jgi:uncharacterized protein
MGAIVRRMRQDVSVGVGSLRAWMALAILVLAYFIADPFELTLYHGGYHVLHLHSSAPNTLGKATFGVLMLVRLLWNGILWVALCAAMGADPVGFPIRGKRMFHYVALGFATGFAVMFLTMVTIWGVGAATVSLSRQSFLSLINNGVSWLVLDFLGALGEELYGRAIVLIVAARFLGWRGAVLVSGAMFSVIHLHNLGSTRIWLLRVFLQGAVLAYATLRTRSIWWFVGYHTGWNWVSAPLFGAAGSGYLDEGHVFDLSSHGSSWITGGAVGPEGSIFAFVAVLTALALVFATTRSPTQRSQSIGD